MPEVGKGGLLTGWEGPKGDFLDSYHVLNIFIWMVGGSDRERERYIYM